MNSIPKAQGSEDHYDKPFSCIVMSKSEGESVQNKLYSDFKLTYASGAGYKILCAVDGLVGAYVLSQVHASEGKLAHLSTFLGSSVKILDNCLFSYLLSPKPCSRLRSELS